MGRNRLDSSTKPLNGWLWVELWTENVESAARFYGSLLGYVTKPVTVAGKQYTLFLRDSTPTAGLLKIPVEDVRPNWLPTIRVSDVDATVARAVELGGRVIMAPRADVRNSTVAIIADPTGAALTVQELDDTVTAGTDYLTRTGSRCTLVMLTALVLLGAAACFQVGNTDIGQRGGRAAGAVGRGDDRDGGAGGVWVELKQRKN